MNTSTASSSYSKEHIPPFTAQYAQRISKIHEQREILSRKKEDDIIHARSAVGSTFRVSGPDNSKVYSGDRTFGFVRPISVGRQRGESPGRSGSAPLRSSSSERLRQSNDTQISYSSVQRTMTSFDRELQAQKDIAAIEKQKLALLQVKKESYINYLKNKGNTPWVPGGEGAKYDNSLHKSVNKDALTQRQLKQAWCRSPWPSSVPREQQKQDLSTNSGLNDTTFSGAGGGGVSYRGQPYDNLSQSPYRTRVAVSDASSKIGEYYGFSPDRDGPAGGQQQSHRPIRAATSPQRLPGRSGGGLSASVNGRDRADSDLLSVYSSAAPSVASSHRSRLNPNVSSSNDNGAAPAGSNSKYVALTVRLINTAHPSQKSSYGVFIVPRNCTRLEMIAHIERQFSVHNQVSDISITYRSGYSHSVTVKSLSMGTIAEVPDVNDYSSITIYLGGSTVFDSHGNIITKSATGEVISSKLAVLDKPVESTAAAAAPAGLTRATSGRDFSYNSAIGSSSPNGAVSVVASEYANGYTNGYTNGNLTASGFGAGGAGVSSMGGASSLVPGLDVGDTLQFFDGVDVTYVEDDNDNDNSTYYSEANSFQPSVAFPPPPLSPPSASASTSAPSTSAAPRPVQVPMYESLHPLQKHHSFSYASPAMPLLGGQKADTVLGSPKGSYYAPNPPAPASQQQAKSAADASSNRARPSAYEIQSYLLPDDAAKPETTTFLRSSSSSNVRTAGASMGTSGSRFHDENLRQSILTKKSSFSSPYESTPASTYSFYDGAARITETADTKASTQELKENEKESALGITESSFLPPQQQEQEKTPRLPRDWLAEAEAEAQIRLKGRPQHQKREQRPLRSRKEREEAVSSMSEFSSPAYRANTVSSQLRSQNKPAAPATSVNQVRRARSRSQSRSELDQAPRGRASSAGRTGSAGRARSHSADALSRLHPRYQQSPHQQQQQQQPWRPLPMPVSPGGPPLVRTTAASRGRTAFITHRAGDATAAAAGGATGNTRDSSSGRGRPRSSSAGSSRSLQGGRRSIHHSFSHNELPPAEDFDDVWLADPPLSRFHGKRGPAQTEEEEQGGWQEQQEQQRMQDYHSLYAAEYPSAAVQNGHMRQPRIKEGPQAGGAGDSHIDLHQMNETDDLLLPWSRSEEAPNNQYQQHQQQEGGGEGEGGDTPPKQNIASATRRGSGRSTSSSGRHFAMNLDELLAEMA